MPLRKSIRPSDDVFKFDQMIPCDDPIANMGLGKRVCLGAPMLSSDRANALTANDMRSVLSVPPAKLFAPVTRRVTATLADEAWAAGLFDGEGCIHIARQTYGTSKRRATYRLRLNIAQVNAGVLREFEWAVGVHGRLYSPKPSKKQTRICHALVYDGLEAFLVLKVLREHLRRKRAQADLAEEFREKCDIHRHPGPRGLSEEVWELRRWFYERMMQLNKER